MNDPIAELLGGLLKMPMQMLSNLLGGGFKPGGPKCAKCGKSHLTVSHPSRPKTMADVMGSSSTPKAGATVPRGTSPGLDSGLPKLPPRVRKSFCAGGG